MAYNISLKSKTKIQIKNKVKNFDLKKETINVKLVA